MKGKCSKKLERLISLIVCGAIILGFVTQVFAAPATVEPPMPSGESEATTGELGSDVQEETNEKLTPGGVLIRFRRKYRRMEKMRAMEAAKSRERFPMS